MCVHQDRQDDPERRLVWVTGAACQGDCPSWTVLCWLEGVWAGRHRGRGLCSPLRNKLPVPRGLPFKLGSPVGDEVPCPRRQHLVPFADPVGSLSVTPDAISLINNYTWIMKLCFVSLKLYPTSPLRPLLLIAPPLTSLPAQWTWFRLLCLFLRLPLIYHLLLPLHSLVPLSPPQLLMLLHPMPHLPRLLSLLLLSPRLP